MIRSTLFVIASVSICHAQQMQSIFHWENAHWGLAFEDTNLTAQVKETIRNDIEHVFSWIPTTNVAVVAGTVEYGIHRNPLLGVPTEKEYIPSEINLSTYKTQNTTNYFTVSLLGSSNYLAKIALTNAHPGLVEGMSNFLVQVALKTSSNTTDAVFTELFWSLEENRKMVLADWGDRNCQQQKELYLDVHYYFPSLLDFQILEYKTGVPVLICSMRKTPNNDLTAFRLGDVSVFVSNQCFFADWQFP
ncbi:MAG: hypothetical protein WCK89_13175 [bacterium]